MNGDHSSHHPDNHQALPEAEEFQRATPFDLGSMIEAVARQWRCVAIVSTVCLLAALFAAIAVLRPGYTVSVQLSGYDAPLASDAFKPHALSSAALFAMISSPDALQRTGAELTPPVSAEVLARRLYVALDRNSELITVTATGASPEDAVALANLFARDTVERTQALQKAEAGEAGHLVAEQRTNNDADRANLSAQLAQIETRRATARQEAHVLRLSSAAPTVAKVDTAKITRLEERTQIARDDLADLLARFTDAHPLVREQKARLAAFESQLAQAIAAGQAQDAATEELLAAANPAPEYSVPADQSTGYDALTVTLAALELSRAELVARERAIQIFVNDPPGYLHVVHAATVANVLARYNRLNIGVLALLGGALGALAAIVLIAIREMLDDRLKTAADVMRVTRLPLLATLGNLDTMSPARQAQWAFRSWTALQHALGVSPNRGVVCGFTSSGPGEGRSTWIELLAQSARKCGFTVLTIASSRMEGEKADQVPPAGKPDEARSAATDSTAFTAMVMTNPAQLMETLTAPNLVRSVNLPLPGGWVWDLEWRKQWQRALNYWRTIDHVAILIELPPLSDPETVLLAENMPNLVWLAESHKAQAAETIEQLETLRHARCRLVGAVLNRAPATPAKRRLARWFGLRTAVLASGIGLAGGTASAQTPLAAERTEVVPIQTQSAFAVVDPAQRAPWQQRLTLGPGDLLNLSVFGQPELTQAEVPVGPDGRVSFLEAQNVIAAGLTIDEFRVALNTELGNFRSAPEVIVIPAAYRSKKYYVLGAVVRKGAFPLNRPMTIIEAVSAADGLEMGRADLSLIVLADLSHSFVARQGRHLSVDFEKLFLEGDLSQNIALEPEDYLYFPLGERQQVYVLGEVRFPGSLVFQPHTGTLEAIAIRGGFSERAWRTRLLVIRGSLDHPQSFVVNAAEVLSAKSVDLKLEPRDIIYVSSRPWVRVEELLDEAASAFVQASVISKVGLQTYPTVNP